MMAKFLARLVLPDWARELLVAAAVTALLLGAGAAYREHVFNLGVAAEKARWTLAQAKADRAADDRLYFLNARISDLQTVLDLKVDYIAGLEKENTNEKARSSDLQSQLADGSRRLSVLVHIAASQAAAAQGASGAGPAAVDPAGGISASLDGRVAADLEWLRQTRSDALAGLHACTESYDAVKAAADAHP